MKIYDITLPIHPEMLHWGRKPEVEVVESLAAGDASNVTRWRIGAHTGTHVDAPAHFVDGATPIDQVSLDSLVGQAVVVDMTGLTADVTAADLEAAGVAGERRILLKTSNSAGILKETERAPSWIGLAPDAATWLVAHGVELIAIDYLTIEGHSRTDSWDVHHELLGNGVLILENADLDAVEPGRYELVCLPAKLAGADGSFTRAILIERDRV
ncbi:Metal-dependent hydrolase [Pseudonocardia sp. Ae406_Ps2]|uniref:cyclase family protein n=1 Tax=unclassified Pseudonocardia TaxID=2619320 RepID=UPI00094AB2D3|nr:MULTISPECIES: cyclase family protein [unclassified Pseudonocardia]OLL99841.1 Metal-dependent hydrolase [Pseudonocardia sp. Ae331_Ps2]OLM02409.1 Metal-dependent hydrolase [Pseudonocardia sp. Ae406_Ps2]OLM12755.1 Metal-dependent hydrolase [Pseudonocardia sp. Ae505_Ps2]OLM23980.1 Metal-dependent hydrolase [Pseudonocardia sp. Ae706_Ps2]OLM30068.1 Metal-dependent hydrolase [Pseudonocardia sp. Ae717_Ps2]